MEDKEDFCPYVWKEYKEGDYFVISLHGVKDGYFEVTRTSKDSDTGVTSTGTFTTKSYADANKLCKSWIDQRLYY